VSVLTGGGLSWDVLEEFTLQNYDMSCVVKTAAGKELAK